MGTQKFRGLVIKEFNNGETSKKIVILAKEYGKVLLSARGAKKTGSKFLAGTQLFAYCDYVAYEGSGFNAITQVDVIETFYGIRNDIVKLAYGTYLLELVEKTILESMESDDILEVLLRALFLLSKENPNERLVKIIFEIKYLKFSGLLPDLNYCLNCGEPEVLYFYSNGLICERCAAKDKRAVKLLNGTVKALIYIFDSDKEKLFKFSVSDEILFELEKISGRLIEDQIPVQLKTLEFIDKLY